MQITDALIAGVTLRSHGIGEARDFLKQRVRPSAIALANWDPYPLANEIEAFTIALTNMDVAVEQRIERFANLFITGISPVDVLTPAQLRLAPGD